MFALLKSLADIVAEDFLTFLTYIYWFCTKTLEYCIFQIHNLFPNPTTFKKNSYLCPCLAEKHP